MIQVECSYIGDLKCEAKHLKSGSRIYTNAPLDHCGKGENFSPTDLLATSLGTCLLTIIAIKARSKGWELENISLDIDKIMTKKGKRQIEKLIINIYIPEYTSKEKFNFFKKASKECPVTRNLSESLNVQIYWHFRSSLNKPN